MRILKKIIFVLLGLIGIVLITGLVMSNDYAVVREITINQPKDSVFNYVKMMKNQDYFSVWNMKDPNSKRTFTGTDGEIGFIYSWNGNDEVGEGEQEIKKIVPGERIDMELRFKRPMASTDYGYFVTESLSANQTKVKWGFNGKMPYPMNVMMLFMNMDEMLGKDLQASLINLKSNLEKK
jgi:hypothetical protein